MLVLFGGDFYLVQLLGDVIGLYWLFDDASYNMPAAFVSFLLRSSKTQLIALKLYCTTGMAKVLITYVLLAELNSVFNIALTHL